MGQICLRPGLHRGCVAHGHTGPNSLVGQRRSGQGAGVCARWAATAHSGADGRRTESLTGAEEGGGTAHDFSSDRWTRWLVRGPARERTGEAKKPAPKKKGGGAPHQRRWHGAGARPGSAGRELRRGSQQLPATCARERERERERNEVVGAGMDVAVLSKEEHRGRTSDSPRKTSAVGTARGKAGGRELGRFYTTWHQRHSSPLR
jgi:hypothetical protein